MNDDVGDQDNESRPVNGVTSVHNRDGEVRCVGYRNGDGCDPVLTLDASRESVEHVVYDCGLDAFIPTSVLDELTSDARTYEIVVRNGIVLTAPGALDLGRSRRLPNIAQRRVLRALYATCAIPGCAVRYDNTRIHHIRFWRNGGRTDLHNLLPLCVRHHHYVHDRDWRITMSANRSLIIDCGNGFTMTTGPPTRSPTATDA